MGCIVPFRLVADIDIYDQHGPCVLIQVIGSESSDARFREICNKTANATFVKTARLAAGLPEKHEAAGPVDKMLGCLIVPSWSFWKPANAESQLVAWLRKIASSRSKVRPVGFVACPIMAAAWCDPLLNSDNHTQALRSNGSLHSEALAVPRGRWACLFGASRRGPPEASKQGGSEARQGAIGIERGFSAPNLLSRGGLVFPLDGNFGAERLLSTPVAPRQASKTPCLEAWGVPTKRVSVGTPLDT